ncbi:hypothetical protein AcetOrient_orf01548 [Acetobacter orientalis]|uniref:Uncharacterized protein n=1 Tax=Acetobacter orientalis TaxID=146474 RepID=A0A2Z5ZFR3_9PROT|nr:hypothetical protein AcetOrient_orf01548 [Acetobacter orientalis]
MHKAHKKRTFHMALKGPSRSSAWLFAQKKEPHKKAALFKKTGL